MPRRLGRKADRRFGAFENDGSLTIALVGHRPLLERVDIDVLSEAEVGGLTMWEKAFLDFHGNKVLPRAAR